MSSYVNRKCRCDLCVSAARNYNANYREQNGDLNKRGWGKKGNQLDLFFRKMLQSVKSRANIKGRECNLTVDYIQGLYFKNPRCAITGVLFVLNDKARRASLDRIDLQKGYVVSNVRLVLCLVNYAMNDYGEEVFWEVMKDIIRMKEIRDLEALRSDGNEAKKVVADALEMIEDSARELLIDDGSVFIWY